MIELPYPAKILWPNGRGHYMARHREFQKHRQWAQAAGLAYLRQFWDAVPDRIHWTVTFYPKTRHPIDDDNARASLKAYQDGLAAAIGVNDNIFSAPTIQWGEPVKGGKVVVEIAA